MATKETKYIVTTCLPQDQETFSKQVKKSGLEVFLYPTIKIKKTRPSKLGKEILSGLNSFDWILFTSKFGVRFFLNAFHELGVDPLVLNQKKIGVVGPRTAEEAKKYHLEIDFIPSQFSTEDLARELPDPKGMKILLPRVDIARDTIIKLLTKRGATVTKLPIYQTKYTAKPNKELETLIVKQKIAFITFTSPSTIKGFCKSLYGELRQMVVSIPILAIGPVTANAAKQAGFRSVYIADTFTTEGMIKKLQEIV